MHTYLSIIILVFNRKLNIQLLDRETKNGTLERMPLFKYVITNYLSAFFASAFFVTSYMIGVAMKIEA